MFVHREAYGFGNRSRTQTPISGSITVRVLTRPRGRCECCEAHEHQRALDVDHIVPRNQSGTGNLSNLQALCFRCNADKRKAGCVLCALEGSGLVLLESELVRCIAAADLVIKGQVMSFQSCPPQGYGQLPGSAVAKEFLHGHADVLGDLTKQRWRNVAALMRWNGGAATTCIAELQM